jgi:hypothetical protein
MMMWLLKRNCLGFAVVVPNLNLMLIISAGFAKPLSNAFFSLRNSYLEKKKHVVQFGHTKQA